MLSVMMQIYIFASGEYKLPEEIASREISLRTYNLQLLFITYVVLPNLAICILSYLLHKYMFNAFIMSFFLVLSIMSCM